MGRCRCAARALQLCALAKDTAAYERDVAVLRAMLGRHTARWWDAGRALDAEQAVALALMKG